MAAPKEIFKEIPDSSGMYFVSNLGNVRNALKRANDLIKEYEEAN